MFVLTHHARAPLVMEGDDLHFVTEGIAAALRKLGSGRRQGCSLGGGVQRPFNSFFANALSTRCTSLLRQSCLALVKDSLKKQTSLPCATLHQHEMSPRSLTWFSLGCDQVLTALCSAKCAVAPRGAEVAWASTRSTGAFLNNAPVTYESSPDPSIERMFSRAATHPWPAAHVDVRRTTLLSRG